VQQPLRVMPLGDSITWGYPYDIQGGIALAAAGFGSIRIG
jgi:hypothetical protein